MCNKLHMLTFYRGIKLQFRKVTSVCNMTRGLLAPLFPIPLLIIALQTLSFCP